MQKEEGRKVLSKQKFEKEISKGLQSLKKINIEYMEMVKSESLSQWKNSRILITFSTFLQELKWRKRTK